MYDMDCMHCGLQPVYSVSLLEVSVVAPSKSSKARCKVRCVAARSGDTSK